jgi:hypothetical protein
MAKPDWEQTWTIEAATDLAEGPVFNKDGTARIKLTAHHWNKKIAFYLAEPVDAPPAWRDVVLFPRGLKDVPDTFRFNPPPDPGPMSPATAAKYLSQAEDMRANVSQNLNNHRLEGDLHVVGKSVLVTLCLVQRGNEPKDWYLVVYARAPGNPDGGGVGHH